MDAVHFFGKTFHILKMKAHSETHFENENIFLLLLGLYAYFRPQWNKLESIEIWVDAAKQIIFSLGPACGCVITLSSYNQFNRDCQKDAVVIAIANGLTSLFSGCVVFAILGYMAHEANKPVFEVVKVGSYCTNYLYNKLGLNTFKHYKPKPSFSFCF